MILSLSACSGSSGEGGGSVDSDAALQGLMQAIALDFAQVLADVAPQYGEAAEKQDGAASCPEGGGADWADSGFGGGTLTLDACQMKGIAITGTLSGTLESGPDYVDGSMLRGPISATGSYSAELNVTNLILSAQLPATDEFTYWEVTAMTSGGKSLCAWSGGSGCAPSPF
jgi:hypothetical protein